MNIILNSNKDRAVCGLILFAVLVVFLVFILRDQFDEKPVVSIAKKADEVRRAPRVNTKVDTVKVYGGGNALKKKLSLPDKVVKAKSKQVIAASKVPASDFDHTITTVIDLDTGDSETYIRRDPLPWFSFSGRGAVGLYYGLRNGRQAVRAQLHQELARVKRLSFAAIGSVDFEAGQSPDAFVGVGAAYRW